jgi:multimeric flavodoxin WrbA
MKVVAINGSAKKDSGRTAAILNQLLDGLKESGAMVEKFNAYELDLKSCKGEFSCWFNNPGQCFQKDDMQWLSPKLQAADVWILASPVYSWGFSGALQTVLDRTVSGIEPFFSINEGHSSHPLRQGSVERTIALVSSCGLWEMDNFDPLLAQIRLMCLGMGFHYAGALLRPHSEAMRAFPGTSQSAAGVLEAAHEAGRELSSTGMFSQPTMDAVSCPLTSMDQYLELSNRFLQSKIGKTRAGTLQSALSGSSQGFTK